MDKVSTIGLDIAKPVFQVHGLDAEGTVVLHRNLRRDDVVGFFKNLPSCLVGIEARATDDALRFSEKPRAAERADAASGP